MTAPAIIDVAELQERVAQGAGAEPGAGPTRVVDCRFSLAEPAAGRQAWAQGTIAGAAYADLDSTLSDIDPSRPTLGRHPLPCASLMAGRLGALGINNQHRVVAFDDSGGAYAARLWWTLRWLGHDAVQVLDGGWAAWQAEGGATRPGSPLPPESFAAHERPEMRIDGATLALLRDTLSLVDARAPERFAGEHEPLDAKAGHIPGACNMAWRENLDGRGRMRAAEDLRARFEGLFKRHAPHEIVAYCGSGVTACHNLLAMHRAGLFGAKLYVGSWSGWSADRSRPIASGPDSEAG